MNLWNRIINWLGIGTFDAQTEEEVKFIINPRRKESSWSKNKFKSD
jgi:hypothetical protein